MNNLSIALLAIVAVVLFIGITTYNRMIALRQVVKNAFADVDVQMKQRYDLVPNLVETVKGYAAHESGVLEKVTEARAHAMRAQGVGERNTAETTFSQALLQMMAVAENYPQLKANENFQQLQTDLSNIEDKIAASRRFFNSSVAEYNTAISQFPALALAELFNFSAEAMFTLGDERTAASIPPKVSFGT